MSTSFIEDFYPTPPQLIEKMLEGVKLDDMDEILDLGAGRGDIAEFVVGTQEDSYRRRRHAATIDVVEINPDFQHILKGKGFRLVHDDILTFQTHKVYDLIVANFPFSVGAECLQKALSILERNGGQLRCLVNAETIRNTFTNLRIAVAAKLESLGADIEYLSGEFEGAERKTDVQVALIKLQVERPESPSIILDALKKAPEVQAEEARADQLVESNYVAAMVARFNVECRLGAKIIEEYFTLRPHISDRIKRGDESDNYSNDLITLEVKGAYGSQASYVNHYLSGVRYKYWSLLLHDSRFNGVYTSNILSELDSKLTELRDYDFTPFNIQALIEEMRGKIVEGIEKSILNLFDKCSRKFTYNESIEDGNVWYYNGWKTNKAHKINSKIILPINGISSWCGRNQLEYRIHEELADMVKVFNYLSEDRGDVGRLVGNACEYANRYENFRGIDLRYFDITFYKKGTAHIKFKDEKLLAKFNIFGSQRKGWLPPAYGKKAYEAMDEEERAVVDDFQGREAYDEVMRNAEYYIVESTALLQLGAAQEAA